VTQIHDLTVTELTAAIRTGETSSAEITEHYLGRIDRLNEQVGAFYTVTHELAREEAARADKAASAWRKDGSAAELPALGQRAEHVGDGAVVLLGQHLGRGQQRGLAPRVDHLEHRPDRDDRLARSDLPLEQPVHGVVAGQVGTGPVARSSTVSPGVKTRSPGTRARTSINELLRE